MHRAFDCHVAFLSGQSAVAVAAWWLDRLKLLEVELGDGLQPVGQFRSFEVVRDVVEPGAGGAARAPRVGVRVLGMPNSVPIATVTFRGG